MELLWSVIPTVIAMVMFGWGASVFYHLRRPPEEAMHIYAVGKQWMWKFQHLEGQREINELHVPVGRPVKITVTSEDVVHSLYFPSFRTKIDAIPGRYMELWFEATKVGTYHIFCAEYCGTNHSRMIGSVTVMEPVAFQSWLAGGGEGSLAERGSALFQQLACNSCHLDSGQGRGPSLKDIFGKPVELADGSKVDGRRSLSARIDPQLTGEDRQRVPAADAHLPGAHQRGGPRRPDRTPPIDVAKRRCGTCDRCGTVAGCGGCDRCDASTGRGATAGEPAVAGESSIMQDILKRPALHYLNNGHGLKSWLLTKDHKRIAIMYLISISVFFFIGGLMASGVRLELATPAGRLRPGRHLQQDVHAARRDHGVPLPDPVDSGHARELPDSADDWRQGSGVPAHQSAESLYLLVRRHLHPLRDAHGRCGYGLDVLHAVQRGGLEHQRHSDGAGCVHRRLLVDPDRPELHRHDPSHAGAGHDVVQAAACSCGRTTPRA